MPGCKCLKWVSDDCQKSDTSFVRQAVRHFQTLVDLYQLKQGTVCLTFVSDAV